LNGGFCLQAAGLSFSLLTAFYVSKLAKEAVDDIEDEDDDTSPDS
jgi:hypothetical protein